MGIWNEPPAEAESTETVVEIPPTSSVYEGETKQLIEGIQYNGDPWKGTWYSQLLDEDDIPQRLDLKLSPTIQQYVKIVDFVVLQSSELSPSTDENIITELTAEAVLYPSVTPNRGDHFVAPMSDGRIGLFVVTALERTGYYAQRTHQVTLELVDYMNETYQANLDLKTVQTLYFDPANPLSPGTSSQATLQRYDTASKLMELVHWWWDEFYDLTTRTGIHPGYEDSGRTYDAEVIEFLTKILPYDIYKQLPKLFNYPIPSQTYKKQFSSVWDILVDGEVTHLKRIDRYVRTTPIAEFRAQYVYSAVGFSHVDRVIIPSKQSTLVGYNAVIAEETVLSDTYVMSSGFFEEKVQEMTPLELIVYKAITQQSFTLEEVVQEIDYLYEAPLEKQFYRIPVMIWLLLRLI